MAFTETARFVSCMLPWRVESPYNQSNPTPFLRHSIFPFARENSSTSHSSSESTQFSFGFEESLSVFAGLGESQWQVFVTRYGCKLLPVWKPPLFKPSLESKWVVSALGKTVSVKLRLKGGVRWPKKMVLGDFFKELQIAMVGPARDACNFHWDFNSSPLFKFQNRRDVFLNH